MYSVAEKSKSATDPAIESLDKHECKVETKAGQRGERVRGGEDLQCEVCNASRVFFTKNLMNK